MLRKRVREEVEAAVGALGALLTTDGEVFLDEAARMLAERLKPIAAIDRAVREAQGYGDSPAETNWYLMLSKWIIENQLGGELCWDSEAKLVRREKSS